MLWHRHWQLVCGQSGHTCCASVERELHQGRKTLLQRSSGFPWHLWATFGKCRWKRLYVDVCVYACVYVDCGAITRQTTAPSRWLCWRPVLARSHWPLFANSHLALSKNQKQWFADNWVRQILNQTATQQFRRLLSPGPFIVDRRYVYSDYVYFAVMIETSSWCQLSHIKHFILLPCSFILFFRWV